MNSYRTSRKALWLQMLAMVGVTFALAFVLGYLGMYPEVASNLVTLVGMVWTAFAVSNRLDGYLAPGQAHWWRIGAAIFVPFVWFYYACVLSAHEKEAAKLAKAAAA